jgi:hypothetical protein
MRRAAGDQRDRLGVTPPVQDARMNIQLSCPWCNDETDFWVDEADDELVCAACATRMAFAPDPATTFGLLYEPLAA